MEKTAETKDNLVILDTPLKRGETLITEIEVLRPNAGGLRGVRLADIANSDVDALMVLLPRVTVPNLTKDECARLSLPDFVSLAGQVISFLSPKSAA